MIYLSVASVVRTLLLVVLSQLHAHVVECTLLAFALPTIVDLSIAIAKLVQLHPIDDA